MEGEAVKRRTLNHYSGTCLISSYSGSNSENQKYSVVGSQITYSQAHPELFVLRRTIKQAEKDLKSIPSAQLAGVIQLLKESDVGGSFFTTKHYSSFTSPKVIVRNANRGPFTFNISSYLFAATLVVTDVSTIWPEQVQMSSVMEDLLALGTVAIARTAPTVPTVSLANFVGELKNDGLPSLIGSIAYRAKSLPKLFKAAGSEYLNVEFGWKPLLSDILGICSTVSKSKQILEQYEKRSGQIIGRSYAFPEIRTTSYTDMGLVGIDPVFNTYAYGGTGQGRKTRTVSSVGNYWFEGRYKYYLPLASEARDKVMLYAAEAEKLLGLEITPEVLWNLAPWSWLSDWFFNIGSIMTNVSAFSKDNLLLTRGYIMGHTRNESVYTNSGVNVVGFGDTGPVTQTFLSETKARRRATPWGFGLTFAAFTPRQIAILAALGISRDWHASKRF